MKLSAHDFLDVMEDKEEKKVDHTIRFGTIDPAYTSGRPRVIFDGTETVSVKEFPYTGRYIPTANDRVVIVKNVIFDKIM